MTRLMQFFHGSNRPPRKRSSGVDRVSVSRFQLDDAIEDAQLNAIADERKDGPFVRVSLDDL